MMTGSASGRSFSLVGSSDLLRDPIDPPSLENDWNVVGLYVREASIIHQKVYGLEDDVSFIFRR